MYWGQDAFPFVTVPPEGEFSTYDAAASCGLKKDGDIVCQRYIPDLPHQLVPADVRFESISFGNSFGCGVTMGDHRVRCWGDNAFGKVSTAPIDVPFDMVSAGVHHACGIRIEDRHVQCWGADRSAPEGVAFDDIQLGWGFACGQRRVDQSIMCWGNYVWNP